MIKIDCVAHDDDGSEMTYQTLFTICPLAYVEQARDIAIFHLNNVEHTGENDPASMLPTILKDSKTGEVTHYCCHRSGYDNTIRNQMATMTACNLNGDTWVSDTVYYIEDKPNVDEIKSKFCLVIGPKYKIAKYLGLVL